MKPQQFATYNQFYLQSPSPDISSYRDLEAIDFYRSFAEMKLKPRPPRHLPIVVISNDWGFGEPAGVTPDRETVLAVWLRHVAYNLTQSPGDARNWIWTSRNVDSVLRAL